jgi:threonine/homoserine/homoserine lactone efflux protein
VGAVIGELLPSAIGVAISPIPIIAVILMLLSRRARANSVGFLIGWLFGIIAATAIIWAISGAADLASSTGPTTAASWISLVVGILLLLLGIGQWRKRPKAGEVAALPKWMASIEDFTAIKAAGLAVVLSAANPKNLLMFVAAGTALGESGVSTRSGIVALIIFTVLAASSVLVPVLGYLFASEKVKPWLDELREWLQQNNAAVMSVLFLVLGVTQLGKGLSGLL